MKISDEEKILLKAFGKALTEIRKSRGLTQRKLATRASVSYSLIVSVETGRRWPHLTILHRIAEDGLNIPLSDIFSHATWPDGYS